MKTIKNKKHRGEILKAAADYSGMTVDAIVKRMKYASRNTFYNHVKNPNLSLNILKKYEAVLKYNFADDIEELADLNLSEEHPGYVSEPKTRDEAIRQRDFYIKLYMELLEDFRRVKEDLAKQAKK